MGSTHISIRGRSLLNKKNQEVSSGIHSCEFVCDKRMKRESKCHLLRKSTNATKKSCELDRVNGGGGTTSGLIYILPVPTTAREVNNVVTRPEVMFFFFFLSLF